MLFGVDRLGSSVLLARNSTLPRFAPTEVPPLCYACPMNHTSYTTAPSTDTDAYREADQLTTEADTAYRVAYNYRPLGPVRDQMITEALALETEAQVATEAVDAQLAFVRLTERMTEHQ